MLDLEKVNGFVNLKQGSKLTISSDYQNITIVTKTQNSIKM